MLKTRVTSNVVCCHECRQPAPFLPNGLTDWHLNTAGGLCAGVFPSYVIARDPLTKSRRPVAGHGIRRRS